MIIYKIYSQNAFVKMNQKKTEKFTKCLNFVRYRLKAAQVKYNIILEDSNDILELSIILQTISYLLRYFCFLM